MKALKNMLFLLLAVMLTVGILWTAAPQAEAATVSSGTCGESAEWTLDDAGTLTVSGTGAMTDFKVQGSPFYHNNNILSVVIEDGVTTIGSSAFTYCEYLTDVTIPSSVTTIGNGAFYACYSLSAVTIPEGVTTIGNWAFDACHKLTEVKLPDSVTTIGDGAFCWCDELTSITIPARVTTIGDLALDGCDSLTGIWVAADNSNYSSDAAGILFDKAKTTLIKAPEAGLTDSYTVPDSVTTVAKRAFASCDSLSITIPSSVTAIGEEAFYWSEGLTDITIPESVTTIGNHAFYGCESLADVYYYGTEEQWEAISADSYIAEIGNVTVHYLEPAAVKEISIRTAPNKVIYGVSESLDTAGLTLMATYDDGSTKIVTEGFTVTGFDPATPGTQTLIVTYEGCTATYTVTVKDNKTKITTQPGAVEIVAGNTAEFKVEAVNAAAYCWQYRRNSTAPWVNTTLTGCATDALSVPAVHSRNGYQYRCRITAENGAVLYTDVATLTVKDSIVITSQPTGQDTHAGTRVTFSVTASGEGLTYQWQYRKNGSDTWKKTTMSGYNSTALSVPAHLTRNGYQYRCAITDANGVKLYSEYASLSVTGIISQPNNQLAQSNTSAVFALYAPGEGFTYQWQYRKSEDGSWMTTSLSGARTDTLTVAALMHRDGYQYRCRVTDALGGVMYSDIATLTVE